MIGGVVALALLLFVLTTVHIRDSKKRKTIAEQAAVLAAIYNSVPAMMFTKDINGLYTSCNDKFQALSRADRSEIIGKYPHELET
jgi:PAS domain-containing protein